MDLKSKIRVIEDFPVKGISFKDITTLTKDKEAFTEAINLIIKDLEGRNIDYIVGPEARGFLVGGAVAFGLGVGFIPIRRPGKLPSDTIKNEYKLEYGINTLEMHDDAIEKGKKIAIVDDLLATGGTVKSAIELIESIGGKVEALEFLIELESLKGRDQLKGYHINTLVKYEK